MTTIITFGRVIPILRIFDLAKADEFYLDYLGSKQTGIIGLMTTPRFTARFPAAI